jgi:hypothetical protein
MIRANESCVGRSAVPMATSRANASAQGFHGRCDGAHARCTQHHCSFAQGTTLDYLLRKRAAFQKQYWLVRLRFVRQLKAANF